MGSVDGYAKKRVYLFFVFCFFSGRGKDLQVLAVSLVILGDESCDRT